MMTKFVLEKLFHDREKVHYAENGLVISSYHNKVYVERGGNCSIFALPQAPWQALVGRRRVLRRALRLDQMNVLPVGDHQQQLIVIRQGAAYHVDMISGNIVQTLTLRQSRNALHQGVVTIGATEVLFGEYGRNRKLFSIPIYRSTDAGLTWDTVFEIAAGKARHVHGCFWDEFEERVWVFTGDGDGKSHVIVADRLFNDVEWLGDGTQLWQAVSVFFERDSCYWIMDAPQKPECYLVRLDRRTRHAEKLMAFPGPVWYSKRTTDGVYIVATTVEIGLAVRDKYARILVSRDLEHWEEVARFQHDGLPKLFRFGAIGFADGAQSSEGFYIFGEALRGLEGKAALCSLEPEA